jgi:electron transport complex protein RnfB
MICFRRCSRPEGHVRMKYSYIGMESCESAAILEGGPYMCAWACVGLGDCVRACPFDALYFADGMVSVNPGKCVSCGQCVKVCPHHILQIIPRRARVTAVCATRDKLKAVSDVCEVGCISCSKCIKACPAKAIHMEDNRIEIDHAKCIDYGASCSEVCVNSCPRFILRRQGVVRLSPVAADAEAAAAADAQSAQAPSKVVDAAPAQDAPLAAPEASPETSKEIQP